MAGKNRITRPSVEPRQVASTKSKAGKNNCSRYSSALGALNNEAFNCQSIAEGLAALINDELDDDRDMEWRLAKALSKRLADFASAIDRLDIFGPSGTEDTAQIAEATNGH